MLDDPEAMRIFSHGDTDRLIARISELVEIIPRTLYFGGLRTDKLAGEVFRFGIHRWVQQPVISGQGTFSRQACSTGFTLAPAFR